MNSNRAKLVDKSNLSTKKIDGKNVFMNGMNVLFVSRFNGIIISPPFLTIKLSFHNHRTNNYLHCYFECLYSLQTGAQKSSIEYISSYSENMMRVKAKIGNFPMIKKVNKLISL